MSFPVTSVLIISFLASAAAAVLLLAALARALPSGFLAAAQNERSNHTAPARQIGGLAVIPAALGVLVVLGPAAGLDARFLLCVSIAAALLWLTGFLDDRLSLPVAVRLCAQILAAGLCVYGFGPDFRLLPDLLPQWLEALLMAFALLSFINMTNFMDGLDLMSVTGIGIPLLAAMLLAVFGMAGPQSGALAAATGGALLGFAFFNRPPARIFLGDSGSLPLGLLAGAVFLMVARETALLAGLLLPLYYLLETGSTLVMRLVAGENVLAAHSKHAYQIARRAGWPVLRVIGHVAVLDILLAICAAGAATTAGLAGMAIFAVIGLAATAALLLRLRGIL
ncbi:glycoside hydrolase [Phyllobacterium phragmitis]|uniref:Glycoside hydrolase n=2 Tax=Phyllobacterium phragmitis TaxID=2670329 RepID=A0A2S9IYZ0_9HYPH|nr:glycoside hydrolase [Phyllobacterium phragmitis]